MSVNVNDKSGLVDSINQGYSACGCGNRRYYTKAEIDEMFKNVLDPEQIEQIINNLFEEYIESGDIYKVIEEMFGDIYTKEEIDQILQDYATKEWVNGVVSNTMRAETARTENTYLKNNALNGYATQNWVNSQDFLKDITLTINGMPLHNNDSIIIEGGGGEPVDISGKLDTTAFTQAMEAETARTEATYLKEANLAGYALKTYVDNETATALTSSKTYTDESISAATADLASKSWVNGTVDSSMAAETARTENTYAKITYVDNAISNLPTYTDIEYLLQRLSAMQAEIDWMKENCCGGPDTGDTPTPDTGSTAVTLEVVYNVTSTTQNTQILNALSGIKSYVIDDGTVVTSPALTYKFSSTGECTITYTLVDSKIPTRVFNDVKTIKRVTISDKVTGFKGEYGKAGFNKCSNMQKVVIGSGVTDIPAFAFSGCTSMTEAVLGNSNGCSIHHLEGTCFQGCTSLRKISCYATTAPLVYYQSFEGVPSNGNLYYPVGSNYSSWLNSPDPSTPYGSLPSGWTGHSTL